MRFIFNLHSYAWLQRLWHQTLSLGGGVGHETIKQALYVILLFGFTVVVVKEVPYIGKFSRCKRFAWKNFTEYNFHAMLDTSQMTMIVSFRSSQHLCCSPPSFCGTIPVAQPALGRGPEKGHKGCWWWDFGPDPDDIAASCHLPTWVVPAGWIVYREGKKMETIIKLSQCCWQTLM